MAFNDFGDPCGRKAKHWVRGPNEDVEWDAFAEEFPLALSLCADHFRTAEVYFRPRKPPRSTASIAKKEPKKQEPSPARKRRRELERSKGQVYFAKRGDLVKIGFSTQPSERLRNLENSAGQPFDQVVLTRGDRALEERFHRRWDEHRGIGEWFTATTEILDEMAKIEEESTPAPRSG